MTRHLAPCLLALLVVLTGCSGSGSGSAGPAGEAAEPDPEVCAAVADLLEVMDAPLSEVPPASPFTVADAWRSLARSSDDDLVRSRAEDAAEVERIWKRVGAEDVPRKSWNKDVEFDFPDYFAHIDPLLHAAGEGYLPAPVGDGCPDAEALRPPRGLVGLPDSAADRSARLPGVDRGLAAEVRELLDAARSEKEDFPGCDDLGDALGRDDSEDVRYNVSLGTTGLSFWCTFGSDEDAAGVLVAQDVDATTLETGESRWTSSPVGPTWTGEAGESPAMLVPGDTDRALRGRYAGAYDADRGVVLEVVDLGPGSVGELRRHLAAAARAWGP